MQLSGSAFLALLLWGLSSSVCKPLPLESNIESYVSSHSKRFYDGEDIEAVKLQLSTQIHGIIEHIMGCLKRGIPIEWCKTEVTRRRNKRFLEKSSGMNAATVGSRYPREEMEGGGRPHPESGGYGERSNYPGMGGSNYSAASRGFNGYGETNGHTENEESIFGSTGGSNSHTDDDGGIDNYLGNKRAYPKFSNFNVSGRYYGGDGYSKNNGLNDFIGAGGYPESKNEINCICDQEKDPDARCSCGQQDKR
ncbi:hypothetical protein TcWFU_004931 [Taenia crassiceps]|uniref:Uncharacterized protein n=1 Tax=Taenia crassiceps TaxID=6207 RepID=A0ABR4Q6I5_9CEST